MDATPAPSPAWPRAIAFALVLGVIATLIAWRIPAGGHGGTTLAALDFRAFYCAGETVRAHHDPYLLEPLRSCENRVARDPSGVPWGVTPAPFPGYALAVFVPLSVPPYPVAHALWVGALIGSLTLTALLLADLIAWPALAVAIVLLPTAAMLNLYLGEPTPLTLGALVCAAALAARERAGAAARSPWASP